MDVTTTITLTEAVAPDRAVELIIGLLALIAALGACVAALASAYWAKIAAAAQEEANRLTEAALDVRLEIVWSVDNTTGKNWYFVRTEDGSAVVWLREVWFDGTPQQPGGGVRLPHRLDRDVAVGFPAPPTSHSAGGSHLHPAIDLVYALTPHQPTTYTTRPPIPHKPATGDINL